MSVDIDSIESAESEDQLQYRAISSAAVASVILGLLSFLACLDWMWIFIPVMGIVVGLFAVARISRRRDEFTGTGVAKLGVALSMILLVAGPTRLIYDEATKVPPGYTRIFYDELQPNQQVKGELYPPSARELDGKRVYIEGYIFNPSDTKQFLLVRDQGDCCFGGNPKITDRIQVTLVDPLRLAYRNRLFRVAGTFHVNPTQAIGTTGGVYYHLEADHLQ